MTYAQRLKRALDAPLWPSLLLAATYFVTARLCVFIADTGQAPAALWVPSGISLAGLLYFGPRAWPGVFFGSLLANFAVDLPLAPALALALGNVLDPLVGVWGIRRYAGKHLDFGRTRHVLAFIAFGVIIGPSISGAFGTFGLQLGGVFSSLSDDVVGWIGWSLEDALSSLIISSAVLVALEARTWDWSSTRKRVEVVALLLLLFVNGWVVLSGKHGDPLSEPYLVLPLMLWIVLRLGSPGAIFGNLLLTVIAAVAIVNRQGPFLLDTLPTSMLWMQSFWAIASLTTLLLAAALNEARSERYRQMFDGNQTIQLVLDAATGQIVDANPAACAFYGRSTAAMRGLALRDLSDAPAGDELTGSFVACHRLGNGERREVEVHGSPIQIDGRSLVYAVIHDVTARRRAEEAVRESEQRLQLVVRATNDTVWDWDMRDNSVWHNQGLVSVFGHAADDAESTVDWWVATIHPEDADDVVGTITAAAARGEETWSREYRFRRGNGSYAHVLGRGYLSYDNGAAVRMVGVLLDLSERKRVEEELAHRASHDTLTGLPNRYQVERTLAETLSASRQSGRSMALLIADLNDFKEVNDQYGHQAGDAVLQVVSERWRSVLRQGDTLGRLAGDEFAVVLPHADAPIAAAIAERLVRVLDSPLLLDGRMLRVGASIGVATCPAEASELEALFRCADDAMYAIKRAGGGWRQANADAAAA
jgi:diguanylate cyclase (GGDEF)-like protein/PAS domain S-box-containing protein